jgi:hypothetical protein
MKPKSFQVVPSDATYGRAVDKASVKVAPHSYEKGVAKGSKRQITHTIAPKLLEEMDQIAQRRGQTRAACINMAIFDWIELSR